MTIVIGFILSICGIILSYIGVKQAFRIRKDIAFNHVKIKQTEEMGSLLKHLNRQYFHLIIKKTTNNGPQQMHYYCNIFEIKELLESEDEYIHSIPQHTPIYLQSPSGFFVSNNYSLLNTDNKETNNFIDNNVANALMLFNIKKEEELDYNNIEDKKPLFIIDISSNYSWKKIHKINDNNISTIYNLLQSIQKLKDAIENWYKMNNVNEYNIYINPNDLIPSYDSTEKASKNKD